MRAGMVGAMSTATIRIAVSASSDVTCHENTT